MQNQRWTVHVGKSLRAYEQLTASAPSFLVCYWTLVGKTRRSCIWGPEPPKFVVVDLCARIAAHSHAAAAHANLRAEGSTSNSLTASSRSSARAPPTAPLPPRRRDAASRTAAAT